MSTLRKTKKFEILEILDSSTFTSDDFEVDFGDEGSGNILKITFAHNRKYVFEITRFTYSGDYKVGMCPGYIHEDEEDTCDFSGALEYIESWCETIREELKVNIPIYREVEELKALIQESLENTVDTESDEFSVKELNELRSKFSELQERVKGLEEENVITKKQLSQFISGLKTVDETIDDLPKKVWLKTAANKLVKLVASIGKTQEGRKILTDGARKLIGLD